MNRSTRTLLQTGAALAVTFGLTFATVAAQDEEATPEGVDEMEPMEEMEPGLFVVEPWTRESPMLDLAGAAYMVIHNSTDADDAIVAVSSPVAEFVELHLSSMDDEGMMSMNQVAEIPIPAHADAVLEPGGFHLMLINLSEPLTEGTEVELTLEFMSAEPQTVVAPVMADAPMLDMDDMSEGDEIDMDDSMDDEEEG